MPNSVILFTNQDNPSKHLIMIMGTCLNISLQGGETNYHYFEKFKMNYSKS